MPSPPRLQSNPRYKQFTQSLYTIGDEEQWNNAVNKNFELISNPKILSNLNIQIHPHVGKLRNSSTLKTFRYIFHNLKKGIYVRIHKGKLESFVPFSKHGYVNTWSESIKPSSKFENVHKVIESSQKACNRKYDERRISRLKQSWVTNGHLIRFEYPLREGDTNVECIKNYIQTVCDERHINDVEFFINRRDFPLLKRDGSHPYNPYINFKLNHYDAPENYLPILSMCTNDNYYDISIPTYEDWGRVSYQYNDQTFGSSYMARKERTYPPIEIIPWEDKIDLAVFRGSSTGIGTNQKTNKRIGLALLSLKHPDFLDCKITEWNTRPRLVNENGESVLDSLNPTDFPEISLGNFLTPQEQSQYKYVINIDGHSTAFRISYEFSYGSIVFMCTSAYKIWYSHIIQPYVHYIPIQYDLSDLIDKIKWCRENPNKCKTIIKNALAFYNTYLSREGILNYTENLLNTLSYRRREVSVNYINPIEILQIREKKMIKGIPGYFKRTKIKDLVVILETKHSLIKRNDSVITKEYINKAKEIEFFHEIFSSVLIHEYKKYEQVTKCLEFSDKRSVWKYYDGQILLDFLKDIKFNVYFDIIYQICGILQDLQENFSFVHNDLYPWNIMITKTSDIISYTNKRGAWKSLNTGYKVIILDLGKCHIKYKGCHHGNIRPFNFNTIRDVVMFLLGSSNIIINKYISSNLLRFITYTMNFLNVINPNIDKFITKKDIKIRGSILKKYTTVIYTNWNEMYEPADFLLYLWKKYSPSDDSFYIALNDNKIKINDNLPDDIFDDPELLYETLKGNKYSNNKTFRSIAKILSNINYKYNKKEVYNNINKLLLS